MKRHKTSLSGSYVSSWTYVEAVRELFQNAIDWGDWGFADDESDLFIGSKNAALDVSTLLLGVSIKNGPSIGKYGEGYKLAALVLLREGLGLTIETGIEKWVPKLIQSRTYKTTQLVFDVSSSDRHHTDIMQFVVHGLSDEQITELKKYNLHWQPADVAYETPRGRILRDRPGEIFVGGLYVCRFEDMQFGYDLNPGELNIDRDRRLVSDFDIKWLTSQLWADVGDAEEAIELLRVGAGDVRYVGPATDYRPSMGKLADAAAEAFVAEHGEAAVPVSNDTELQLARRAGHDAVVMVPSQYGAAIRQSSAWTAPPPRIIARTPREMLLGFRVKHADTLVPEALTDLDALIVDAERWRA